MFDPTEEQKKILACNTNCVTTAGPGSGKTATLVAKIKSVVDELPHYKGVAAISYTNKAADEIKLRVSREVKDVKNSFFGTIDKFFLYEIVIPFIKHYWGFPKNELTIDMNVEDRDVVAELQNIIMKYINVNINLIQGDVLKEIDQNVIVFIKKKYLEGIIELPVAHGLANIILLNTKTCRNYLKARYTYMFIDEYQDSGFEQHALFLKINELGIITWAIGDINQSIYYFDKKDSRYLKHLLQKEGFKSYSLTKNHRSHPSIINYSNKLMQFTFDDLIADECRVFRKRVNGMEIDIAKWIDEILPAYKQKYGVSKNSSIAILCRSGRTCSIIDKSLETDHKVIMSTPIDSDLSCWGSVFKQLLYYLFDPKFTFIEFVEAHCDRETKEGILKWKACEIKCTTLRKNLDDKYNLEYLEKGLVDIAKTLYPKKNNDLAIQNLRDTFNSKDYIFPEPFKPIEDSKVQIMTLHKSKGLEFEMVFHLDLYNYIIPSYNALVKNDEKELEQDLNLHYVGITRAKKCVFLTTSTRRTNFQGTILDASVSDFFRSDLKCYSNLID